MNLSLLFSFKTEIWTKVTVTPLKSMNFLWCKRWNILFSSFCLSNFPHFLLSLPHKAFLIEQLLPFIFFLCVCVCARVFFFFFPFFSFFFCPALSSKYLCSSLLVQHAGRCWFLLFTDKRNILWQNPKLAKKQAHKWNHHHHKYQWQQRCQLSQVLDLEGKDSHKWSNGSRFTCKWFQFRMDVDSLELITIQQIVPKSNGRNFYWNDKTEISSKSFKVM